MAVNGQGKNTGVIKPMPGAPRLGGGLGSGSHGSPRQPLPVGPGDITGLPKASGGVPRSETVPINGNPGRKIIAAPPNKIPQKPTLSGSREVEDSNKVTKNKQISRKQKSMVDRLKSSAGKMNNKQKSAIQNAAAKRKVRSPGMPGVSNKLRAMTDR